MTKIVGERVRKLQPVCYREDRKICACARARQMFEHHGITRNHLGTTVRPNDKDGKHSRAKISTDELSGGLGNLRTRVRAIYLTVTESRKIARVPQLRQMMKKGSNYCRQKLQTVHFWEDQEICVRAKSLNIPELR